MPDIIFETAGYNRMVKGRYGHVLYNKNDTYIGKAFEMYGEFSENEVALFRQICGQGDFIFDVGANIGAHTMAFSQMVGPGGRVFAFEPQRIVFHNLCANMSLNCIENVECYQIAVSNKSGSTLIPDFRYDLPANHGGFSVKDYDKGQKTPLEPLDTLLDIPRLKLMKVDVEGMETEVIEGAKNIINKHKPFLYVENDKFDNSQTLIETIMSLDYRLFWHLPPLYNPDNYANNVMNNFPGLVSVNMLCFHRSINLSLDGFEEIVDATFHPMRKNQSK